APQYQAEPQMQPQGQMQQPYNYPQQGVVYNQPVQGMPQYQQAPQYQTEPQMQPHGQMQGQMQQPQQDQAPKDQPLESDASVQEGVVTQKKKPKFDEHKYGQLMDIANDIADGKAPDMSQVMEVMEGLDTQFWKGSMVGALTVFAMTNEAVKHSVVSAMAKIMNTFGKSV
ncbi:MAG: hypothetical protein U9N77_13765, partial [Thermodesulfobacteriota bacterium]|nr:hypothetical protein [Thermodesulfobacteriota bacterium]